MAETSYISVPIEISRQAILDLLTIAVEEGCYYWTRSITRPTNGYDLDSKFIFVEASEDGSVEDDVEHTLDLSSLGWPKVIAGLQLMAKKHHGHFADLIGDNSDVWTADVFVQLVLLGEIRYG